MYRYDASSTTPPTPVTAPELLDWAARERQFTKRRLQFGDSIVSARLPASARLLAGGFSLFGVPLLLVAGKLVQSDPTDLAGWCVGLLGPMVAVVPLTLLRMSKSLSFDFNQGRYLTPQRGIDPFGRPHVEGPLSTVVALQLLDKTVNTTRDTDGDGYSDTASAYRAFELNLVISDGTRVHVLDDVDPWIIGKSAEKLAAMLGVPLWRKPAMRPGD